MTQGRSSRIFPILTGLDFNWFFCLDVGFQVFGLGLCFSVFLRIGFGFSQDLVWFFGY